MHRTVSDPKELTAADLEAIGSRCDRATPGPWKSYVEGRDHSAGSSFIMVGEGDARREDFEIPSASAADLDFIAHARQDVPRLVDEILRLRALLNR